VCSFRCILIHAIVSANSAQQTRLFSKYRAPDEFLELKVTDDVKCVKYLMTAQADMYNLEELNLWFMEQAMGKKA